MSIDPTPAPAPPPPSRFDKIKATVVSAGQWAQRNHAWIAWFLAVLLPLASYYGLKVPAIPIPPMPPIIEQPAPHMTGGQGWVDDPLAVQTALAQIQTQQNGLPPYFGRIAQAAMAADDGKAVFLWEAEQKVLNKQLGSWDQKSVGACVSFGWGRGVQDLLLTQIASGAAEEWPGAEVATEPIYGGSRVQIGGGRIRGDGSVGAWAAQYVQKYGIVFREKYGTIDLTTYSESTARAMGRSGCPEPLQVEARKHPVKTVAMVETADELWAAIGNGYPVPICSNVGFEGSPPADGVMEPRGTWGHCMTIRGRFTDPAKGPCFVVQNSWNNYLKTRLTVTDKDRGPVQLPEGCFAIRKTVAARIVAQKDSFAVSGFVGFPRQNPIDWYAGRPPAKPPRDRAGLLAAFDLAP